MVADHEQRWIADLLTAPIDMVGRSDGGTSTCETRPMPQAPRTGHVVPPAPDASGLGPLGTDDGGLDDDNGMDSATGALLDAVAARVIGPLRLTAEDLAAAAGITVDDIEPIWMELGFVPVDRERPLFAESDLQALELLMAARRHQLVSDDLAVALARVLGQALARVAATEAQTLAPLIRVLAARPTVDQDRSHLGPAGGEADGDDHADGGPPDERDRPVRAALTGGAPVASADDLVDTVADVLVPTIDRFMAWTWRRHLVAALARHLRERTTEVVGFADLVGFTRLSTRLGPDELPDVVGRFQELATHHLVTHGGRVVKTIGDAVLFVFPDGPAAAVGALGLVGACAEDRGLPPVRVGLACGPVVELEGDVYGDTVNRASRLVELARSGSVLADDDTAVQCLDRDDLHVRPLRPRRLKGLGLVKVWTLRPQRDAMLP